MKYLAVLAGAVVVFVGYTAGATARYRFEQPLVAPVQGVAISPGAGERLAGAIRIPTISTEDPATFDAKAFRDLHAYLQEAFPRVHRELVREVIAEHSLLYTWRGTDPALTPILLAGHLDVVPIDPATEHQWQQAPFSGRIADGFIWGRGAIDNKSAVIGVLEAVEMLLAEGFRPARTVYLAYGHDEEVGGAQGAHEIAATLKARGIQLDMILDEGGVICDGVLTGVRGPVALVGIAEKGFVTIELTTHSNGGHSSLPAKDGAIGTIAAAVARLEREPMPARLEAATRQMFDRIGPQFPTVQRAVFANLWLTRPLVVRRLEQSPATNAMIRTTTAVTIFQAGTKDNVLPTSARAVVNFRILPGDSIATVVQHVKQVIGDERVEAKIGGHFTSEPSEVSTTDSESFRTLERSIRSIHPDVLVTPYQVVVVTDARYYAGLSDSIFRFLPVRLAPRDLERMHGVDERLGVAEYAAAIRTFRQIVLDFARKQ